MLEWACRAWQILQSSLIFQGTLCIKAEKSADNEIILACRFGLTATLAMQVSKLITTNSAEHFELMRTNKQHYHSTFPCGLTAETPHLDLGIVLGYAPVTPLHQGTQADQADSEHASQASDYRDCQHSPRHAPISAEDSWCDEDTPGSVMAVSATHSQAVLSTEPRALASASEGLTVLPRPAALSALSMRSPAPPTAPEDLNLGHQASQ